jgi:hypothetical protein
VYLESRTYLLAAILANLCTSGRPASFYRTYRRPAPGCEQQQYDFSGGNADFGIDCLRPVGENHAQPQPWEEEILSAFSDYGGVRSLSSLPPLVKLIRVHFGFGTSSLDPGADHWLDIYRIVRQRF